MLLAEIRGHGDAQIEGNEDYLTSAVFGHLRYIPPRVLWNVFFRRAKALPRNGSEKTLTEAVTELGIEISRYSSLRIHFWPRHPVFGEPDMALHFSGGQRLPLVVLVEVKLWSEKSGIGEFDQLVRYLRVLDDLSGLRISAPGGALKFLLYLTPRESLPEIKDSLGASRAQESDAQKVYRVQWQDLLLAVNESTALASGLDEIILHDVGQFLERRGFEYFNGFNEVADPCQFGATDGSFYYADPDFKGFTHVQNFEPFEPERGRWTR